MKQWDIFLFPHPSPDDPHPGVVVSNDAICQNPDWKMVNALVCQTVRPAGRLRKGNEVYLDRQDGLDHQTLVKCDFIFQFSKSEARSYRGSVCSQRIEEIRRLLRRFF